MLVRTLTAVHDVTQQQTSKDHHFVPKLLLRPWLVTEPNGERHLHGYSWSERRGLSCKRRGLNSFCFQIDLLTLSAHELGRDAIERLFFGEIDSRGAIVRDLLVGGGPRVLNGDQRCDFARLLLSLEARRPTVVNQLRDGASAMAASLDDDRKILDEMARQGITVAPSEYVATEFGWNLEDRSLTVIQQLVDNPKVGGRLINAHWVVKHLGSGSETLVLADRPLIRFYGYDHPAGTWILPVTPTAAFVATNSTATLARIERACGHRFAKLINVASAKQAERFVFSVQDSYEHWLGKHLSRRTRSLRLGRR